MTIRKYLLGVVIVLLIAVVLLSIDDELDKDAEAYLSQSHIMKYSKAFVYMLGIAANEKEDPWRVGELLLASIREAENRYFNEGEEFDYTDYPAVKQLPVPSGELFCRGGDGGCIEARVNSEYDPDAILNEHAILLERYYTYMRLKDYKTLSRPTVFVTLPHLDYP